MSVPTGKNLLGRIVDPLGNVLDTGLKVIDSMVPIGMVKGS
jgi:F0F1-type ATP synthase alpha subunit